MGSISSFVRKFKCVVFVFSILSLKFWFTILLCCHVIWQQRTIKSSFVCCGCFNSPYVLNGNTRNSYKICLIARRK